MVSEKKSLESLGDVQLAVIALSSEEGGNVQKQKVAEEILKERKNQNPGGEK